MLELPSPLRGGIEGGGIRRKVGGGIRRKVGGGIRRKDKIIHLFFTQLQVLICHSTLRCHSTEKRNPECPKIIAKFTKLLSITSALKLRQQRSSNAMVF